MRVKIYFTLLLLHHINFDSKNRQIIEERVMAKATLIVRILMGAMLIVFGLNKFLQFMSMPPPAPEMGAFMGALFATGYIFH